MANVGNPGGHAGDDDDAAIRELILQDVTRHRRSFLPGEPCTTRELRRHLTMPVLVGNVDAEESALMLSALPAGSDGLWVEPLDKGLSGSKVFQARYDRGGGRSKPFVMKVGPKRKIEREMLALSKIVAPTVMGIGQPIYRCGLEKALVVQDLASLSEDSALQSLRMRVLKDDSGPRLIERIMLERLKPWYLNGKQERRSFHLRELFAPYLRKSPTFGDSFPPPWHDLFQEVELATGAPWGRVRPVLEYVADQTCLLPSTTVHGDLHSQNLLVDGEEIWPIDFCWTRDDSSVLVDLAMLECSLKFLALPFGLDMRKLIEAEGALGRFDAPISFGATPYGEEADRVLAVVVKIRELALETFNIDTAAYRFGIFLMTASLMSHPGLNTPYMIASAQILAHQVEANA